MDRYIRKLVYPIFKTLLRFSGFQIINSCHLITTTKREKIQFKPEKEKGV